jgi:hypothetical protein
MVFSQDKATTRRAEIHPRLIVPCEMMKAQGPPPSHLTVQLYHTVGSCSVTRQVNKVETGLPDLVRSNLQYIMW